MAAGVCEVKSEVSQCLFEFLHMQIVSYFEESCGKEKSGEVIRRIEKLGHRVGESLVERVCRDNPRFRTELDAMIFLCKQFWLHLFNKQVDNLKTNNQDMFVLFDNNFRLITHLTNSSQYQDQVPIYLSYTIGLISGALYNLGIKCTVTAEANNPPMCVFQVRIQL